MLSSAERVRKHRSVLAKLVLAVVIAGLVTGLSGSWLIANSAEKALRSEIDQQNDALARSLATRLDDRIESRLAFLRGVATRRPIEELGLNAQTELNVVVKSFADVNRFIAYRIDGSPVAAASSREIVDLSKVGARPELGEQLRTRPSTVTLLASAPPALELGVPIQNPPGTVVGFVTVELPMDEVAGFLTEPQFDPARSGFLTDALGTILVHRDRQKVVAQERFELPEPIRENPGPFRGAWDDTTYFFAAASSEPVPAFVVVQQNESAALGSVTAATRNLIGILLAVIAATVIVVVLVGQHLLAPLGPVADAARRIAHGDYAARVPTLGTGEVGRLARQFNRMADSLQQHIAELREHRIAEQRLRERTQVAETLRRVGEALSAQLNLEQVVQGVTDVATELTHAEFGAFFYNVVSDEGESYMLYTLAGVPREKFADFPMPRNTAIFWPTFSGGPPVRIDDVTKHPDFGRNPPFHGMPKGHLPVRSYLAASVVSRTGDVIGGLFFGHSEPGVFTDLDERLVAGIAAHAAIAIDNARLYEAQRSTSETLQRSLLPGVLPSAPWYLTAANYQPAQPGLEVGGDWYDVIELDADRIALVIGDVAGRGLRAAGTMGQLSHALRAYAIEDYAPRQVLARLSRYGERLGDEDQFATVFYAVYDRASSTLRFANAGHLAPLLLDGAGSGRYLEAPVGLPVGAMPGETYFETSLPAPFEFTLLLYTDGLVEDRWLSLSEGMDRLREAAAEWRGDPGDLCSHVIDRMSQDRELHDDIAVLAFQVRPERPRA